MVMKGAMEGLSRERQRETVEAETWQRPGSLCEWPSCSTSGTSTLFAASLAVPLSVAWSIMATCQLNTHRGQSRWEDQKTCLHLLGIELYILFRLRIAIHFSNPCNKGASVCCYQSVHQFYPLIRDQSYLTSGFSPSSLSAFFASWIGFSSTWISDPVPFFCRRFCGPCGPRLWGALFGFWRRRHVKGREVLQFKNTAYWMYHCTYFSQPKARFTIRGVECTNRWRWLR